MLKVNELKKEALSGMNETAMDFVADLSVNESGYVNDVVSEFADSNTSIYYSDIIKFISENVEDVNDTIDEFGWEGCGGDLYKAGQMAEYHQIENEVYSDIENVLYVFALEYLEAQDITELPEEFADELTEFCVSVESFDSITDFCNYWLQKPIDADTDIA